MRFDVVIVGGGHGGAQAAVALRQRKFSGTVAIVGEEPDLPYERPPLSKEYLAGEKGFERILIRPASFWIERQVAMLAGQRVTAIDPDRRQVTTQAGNAIEYGQLIWAAGGHPRRLGCPGHDAAGVHYVRTRADVDRMAGELDRVTRICVIGGGYIGLEAAAALRKLGKEVVLIEALDRVLARVAGVALSRFFEAEHRSRGVDVRLGVAVERLEEHEGRVAGVRLADGDVIPCEMVVVGIGIIPSVEPMLAAGAKGGNGVAVDKHCQTSLVDIFALGDCALHTNVFGEAPPMRLESVANANDMASVVARMLTGEEAVYDTVPWFWSHQYDLRLQTVGLSGGHDEVVLRGDMATRSFSVVYLRRGCVIALDCVNATKDYVQGRSLVLGRPAVARAALENVAIPLNQIVSFI